MSIDRIDNSQPHSADNVRPVCQIHQAIAGPKATRCWTRAMYLHVVGVQVSVHVPLDRLADLKAEHGSLRTQGEQCPLCEIEPLTR